MTLNCIEFSGGHRMVGQSKNSPMGVGFAVPSHWDEDKPNRTILKGYSTFVIGESIASMIPTRCLLLFHRSLALSTRYWEMRHILSYSHPDVCSQGISCVASGCLPWCSEVRQLLMDVRSDHAHHDHLESRCLHSYLETHCHCVDPQQCC